MAEPSWPWREPAGRGMDRLRCGRRSDSDGRSLRTAGPGLGQVEHAGPRHSNAPRGGRRAPPAGHGWAGSRVETDGGTGRAGRRCETRTCRWRLVARLCRQTRATEPFRNDSLAKIEQESIRGVSPRSKDPKSTDFRPPLCWLHRMQPHSPAASRAEHAFKGPVDPHAGHSCDSEGSAADWIRPGPVQDSRLTPHTHTPPRIRVRA